MEQAARGASALRSLWVITVPDCLVVGSWSRANADRADEAAVELGSLYQSCQSALQWSQSLGHARWVTIESDDVILILVRSSTEVVVVMSFDRRAPLGLIRMQARQVIENVALGSEPKDPLRSRVSALLAEIRNRAPEPRAAVAHLAREAGLTPERIDDLDHLEEAQLRSLLATIEPSSDPR